MTTLSLIKGTLASLGRNALRSFLATSDADADKHYEDICVNQAGDRRH